MLNIDLSEVTSSEWFVPGVLGTLCACFIAYDVIKTHIRNKRNAPKPEPRQLVRDIMDDLQTEPALWSPQAGHKAPDESLYLNYYSRCMALPTHQSTYIYLFSSGSISIDLPDNEIDLEPFELKLLEEAYQNLGKRKIDEAFQLKKKEIKQQSDFQFNAAHFVDNVHLNNEVKNLFKDENVKQVHVVIKPLL